MRKNKYNTATFVDNFKAFINDKFNIDAEKEKFIIKPNYIPHRAESGEDSVFRLVILSDDNISEKLFDFEDIITILTTFEPHYPTKIEFSRINDSESNIFLLVCSTRLRKLSTITSTETQYAPFCLMNSQISNS